MDVDADGNKVVTVTKDGRNLFKPIVMETMYGAGRAKVLAGIAESILNDMERVDLLNDNREAVVDKLTLLHKEANKGAQIVLSSNDIEEFIAPTGNITNSKDRRLVKIKANLRKQAYDNIVTIFKNGTKKFFEEEFGELTKLRHNVNSAGQFKFANFQTIFENKLKEIIQSKMLFGKK